MSSSSSLLALFLTLLAFISAAASSSPSASPLPSPTPSPNKNPFTPTFPPSASPPLPNSAPGPSTTDTGTDCTTLLFGAADCLTYVEEGSNLTAPDKACCPELATLVNTNPICLCQLLKKGNSFGIAINMTKAITLPSVCKVETPDPSLCALVNGGSPAGAPGPTPSDGKSPTRAVLPPTSANNDNAATVVVGRSTSSVLLALMAVGGFTWNML